MIELIHDELVFSFPEVHPEARLRIDLKRTLRIPDDDRDYPLPPGLGSFPMKHVDDYAGNVPKKWLDHGGVMLPMYQSEALWINFSSRDISEHEVEYPFAVKIATGKICAVSGKEWQNGLNRKPQDYVVVPKQPWLDGYCVEKGIIRQFVAMPLGSGYSVEEQLTGAAEHGGIQISVYPMKWEAFEKRFPKRQPIFHDMGELMFCSREASVSCDMGLAPGGRMKQEIYKDRFGLNDWDQSRVSRCFVHLCNSLVWRAITGQNPPTTPPTAKEYTRRGLPWFEYYDEGQSALSGSSRLQGVKSIATLGAERGDAPLPENEPVNPETIVHLRQGLGKHQVREGMF